MKPREALHIAISLVTIAYAFSIVWGNEYSLPAIIVTVGAGFVLHELAHRAVAKHYGAQAHYEAWTWGLLLALLMALTFGFVFAAPGAVYIYGRRLTQEQDGLIALAGPLTNLVLALLFILLMPALGSVATLGAKVNLFLGFFNLIPIFPMDGQKVYAWSKPAWLAAFAALALGAFLY